MDGDFAERLGVSDCTGPSHWRVSCSHRRPGSSAAQAKPSFKPVDAQAPAADLDPVVHEVEGVCPAHCQRDALRRGLEMEGVLAVLD